MRKMAGATCFIAASGLLAVLFWPLQKEPSHVEANVSSSALATSKIPSEQKPETKYEKKIKEFDEKIVNKKPVSARNELEEIQAAISKLEAQLDDDQVIDQLNENLLDQKTRAEFGKQLQTLDGLRAKKLELMLADLDSHVAAIEKVHEQRLKAYGVQK